jgi:hypothetical protein
LAAERASIRGILEAYVEAYESLDDMRIRAVDPTSNGIDSRLRPTLQAVEISVSDLAIDVAPDGKSATLRVRQTFRWKFRARSRYPDETSALLRWNLEKTNGSWRIVP